MPYSGKGLIPRPVAAAAALLVISVWGTSQIATIFVPNYEVPEALHAALMIVLGSLFALRQNKGEENGGSTVSTPPPAPPAPAPDPIEPPSSGRHGRSDGLTFAELQRRLQQERDP